MIASYIVIFANGIRLPLCKEHAEKHSVHDLAPIVGARVEKCKTRQTCKDCLEEEGEEQWVM